MQIPEELLIMSEKELSKVLSDNILNTKYLINKDTNKLYTKVSKVEGKTILKHIESKDLITLEHEDILTDYTPLNKEIFTNLKKNRLLENLYNLPWDKVMKTLTSMAIEVYGEEFVDTTTDSIIIYFPEVTIKNTFEQSHVMRDIFVKFYFRRSSKRLYDIQIARTTFTEKELRNEYLFSHCGSSHVGQYEGELCMGHTQITTLYDTLRNDIIGLIKGFTPFLYILKEYLSWESLEGSPFRKIDNVITDKNRLLEAECPSYNSNKVLSILFTSQKLENLDYTYELRNSLYYAKLTNKSVDDIDKALSSLLESRLMSKVYNNTSVKQNPNPENYYYLNYNNKVSEIVFKGEKIINTIIPDTDTSPDFSHLPTGVHRIILKDIIEKVEKQLTDFIKTKKLEENV